MKTPGPLKGLRSFLESHLRSKNMALICFVSQGVGQDAKTASKILFLAEVMNFLNLAHNTITIRVQTSNRDISEQL